MFSPHQHFLEKTMALTVRNALDAARRKAREQGALRHPVEKAFLKANHITSLDSELPLPMYNKLQISWMRACGIERPVL
jgi:hypothetical protein